MKDERMLAVAAVVLPELGATHSKGSVTVAWRKLAIAIKSAPLNDWQRLFRSLPDEIAFPLLNIERGLGKHLEVPKRFVSYPRFHMEMQRVIESLTSTKADDSLRSAIKTAFRERFDAPVPAEEHTARRNTAEDDSDILAQWRFKIMSTLSTNDYNQLHGLIFKQDGDTVAVTCTADSRFVSDKAKIRETLDVSKIPTGDDVPAVTWTFAIQKDEDGNSVGWKLTGSQVNAAWVTPPHNDAVALAAWKAVTAAAGLILGGYGDKPGATADFELPLASLKPLDAGVFAGIVQRTVGTSTNYSCYWQDGDDLVHRTTGGYKPPKTDKKTFRLVLPENIADITGEKQITVRSKDESSAQDSINTVLMNLTFAAGMELGAAVMAYTFEWSNAGKAVVDVTSEAAVAGDVPNEHPVHWMLSQIGRTDAWDALK